MIKPVLPGVWKWSLLISTGSVGWERTSPGGKSSFIGSGGRYLLLALRILINTSTCINLSKAVNLKNVNTALNLLTVQRTIRLAGLSSSWQPSHAWNLSHLIHTNYRNFVSFLVFCCYHLLLITTPQPCFLKASLKFDQEALYKWPSTLHLQLHSAKSCVTRKVLFHQLIINEQNINCTNVGCVK